MLSVISSLRSRPIFSALFEGSVITEPSVSESESDEAGPVVTRAPSPSTWPKATLRAGPLVAVASASPGPARPAATLPTSGISSISQHVGAARRVIRLLRGPWMDRSFPADSHNRKR